MSSRSFSLVDHKASEAGFFLSQIKTCGYNFFAVQCFAAAFTSSARSTTFALQSVMRAVAGFDEWWAIHQQLLKEDDLARFFHEFRRVNQHVGDNLVKAGRSGRDRSTLYYFMPTRDVPVVPAADVETCCTDYFRTILSLLYECYVDFGPTIDSQQRYTEEYFSSIGLTIEDAEEELGLPRGWTDIGRPEARMYRWEVLRRHVGDGCEINDLFELYLGKTTPVPEPLPPYEGELSKTESG